MKTKLKNWMAVVGLFALVSGVDAMIVDFGEYDPGTIIDSEYATDGADNTSSGLPDGTGFTVSVDASGSKPDIGVLYNTTRTDGFDPDLEGGVDGTLYKGGNLDGVSQGNALVIQNRASSWEIDNGSLYFDSGTKATKWGGNSPNDSANGGSILFSFEQDLVDFGFDWVDLDNSEDASITFIDSLTGASTSILFEEFTLSTSDFFRSGVQFGDATANRIANISIGDLNASSQIAWSGGGSPDSFDQVRFDLNGSGAVSRINFTPVPEPGTVLGGLLLVGFLGWNGYRRWRKANASA